MDAIVHWTSCGGVEVSLDMPSKATCLLNYHHNFVEVFSQADRVVSPGCSTPNDYDVASNDVSRLEIAFEKRRRGD